MSKTAHQYDAAGLYQGTTEADPSPLEPGVHLLPARCTFTAPPADVPAGQWPRWNGRAWVLVNRPAPVGASADAEAADPVAKLQAFLAHNPDVAALLQQPAS